jgi:hypothetical protein
VTIRQNSKADETTPTNTNSTLPTNDQNLTLELKSSRSTNNHLKTTEGRRGRIIEGKKGKNIGDLGSSGVEGVLRTKA